MAWITAGLVIGLVASFIGVLRQRKSASLRKAIQQREQLERQRLHRFHHDVDWRSANPSGNAGTGYVTPVTIGVREGAFLPAPLDITIIFSGPPREVVAQRFDSRVLGQGRMYDCEAQAFQGNSVYLHSDKSLIHPAVIMLFATSGEEVTVESLTLGERPSSVPAASADIFLAKAADRRALAAQITESTAKPMLSPNVPWQTERDEWEDAPIADNEDAALYRRLRELN